MECYQVRGLSFTYPGETSPALEQVDLSIEAGEFVVLCGASGCGKTTLLRLLKPTVSPAGEKSGAVLFCGREISEVPEKQMASEIGFVMQNPENQGVCEYVWQELAFTLESLGFPNGEIRVRVAEMVSFFGIEPWFHQKVSELSGGQKQILNLASVMAAGPKVLILDEPTAQLDPIAAREFLEMLARINKELGTTMILSEQRLEEAIPLAKRVLIMKSGQVVADSPPRELGYDLQDREIYRMLPVPVRIHGAVEPETPVPLTVGEGRSWLEQYAEKNPLIKNRILPKEYDMGDVILEARDLWFRYEKEGKDILKGFSLTLHRGEFYALLGGNGVGKTTALWTMAGLERAYRGKVQLCKKPVSAGEIGVLPQDPKTLFVSKTVLDELREMMPDLSGENKSRMEQVAELCRIGHLFHRHPYDLSGGEQQRVALAKVLLTKAEILFMDEPTKGMDAAFKEEFAGILKELTKQGRTILMVSHDVEFAAKYASRCGLLFDGAIADDDVPEKFFGGKTFYTTAAGRMAGSQLPEVILAEDVIIACGKEPPERTEHRTELPVSLPEEKKEKPQKVKRSVVRIALGILMGILFLLTCRYIKNQPPERNTVFVQILSILQAGCCLWVFFGRKEEKVVRRIYHGIKIPKRTWLGFLSVCIVVPVTGYLGMTLFEGRKYYLTSILILIETLLPFLILWGRRRNTARELVIVAVLCALSVGGRMAFSMVPQFKPVLAMVIIAGICFGGETGFLVGAVTAFVSNFFLGQGPWTPWQMLATGMVGFVAGFLFAGGLLPQKRMAVCVFGFLATVILYGGILNPVSVILYQEAVNGDMILSSYLMGLPFDLIHATSTAFFLWVLQKPMEEKLSRIKIKYGISGEE